ncbi:MAG: 50S ribosomal protein L7/L12 [bacterium]
MATVTREDIIEAISKMTILEVNELVGAIEQKFGVSAAAPVAVAVAGGGAGQAAAAAEEKTEFTVHLKDAGKEKIKVIKEVRVIIPSLGLKEAKDLVDSCPKEVVKDVSKDEAEKVKKQLEAAGATVEIK